MKRFKAIPGKGIVASKQVRSSRKRRIVANHDFDYETYGPDSDPADWTIDYDEFFEAIEANLEELGLEVVDYDDEDVIVGEIRIFNLANGASLDSYDLETEILYALDNGDISGDETDKYIKDYIKKNCMQ